MKIKQSFEIKNLTGKKNFIFAIPDLPLEDDLRSYHTVEN